MSSTRSLNLAAIAALTAACIQAQSVVVSVQAASSQVLVNATTQVAAAISAIDGTPLDPSTLAWNSSDSTIATVSSTGVVTGLAPGDAQIGVTDSNSGATASVMLHVVPASMTLKASAPTLFAGDTVQLTPSALDVAGKPIPNLHFQFRSGESSVASVSSDGIVTGVAEGAVSIEVAIAGIASDPALVAVTQLRILPKPRYKIRKVLSTDTASATTIAAVAAVSTASPAEIGAIVTLANGGQAAVLLEGTKTRVIAIAGQPLPTTGRLVLRIDAISTNSRGDVALLIEYPAQWCNASVFLFPHGQPELELGAANCGNGLAPHSLADDGSVLFKVNDQIWSASATSAPTMLFSLATQPALKDPMRTVDNITAGGGAFVVGGTLASGAYGYVWSDGKTFTPVYHSGDTVRNAPSFSIDLPVATAGGQFYARANLNRFEALVQLTPSGLQTLLFTGDPVTGGTLGWIDNVTDASSAGVLFTGDFNIPNNYHTVSALWKNNVTTEVVTLAGYGGVIAGALPSDGVPVLSAVFKADASIPGLRAMPSGSDPRLLLASGSNFPQPAPAGIDWHYASRAGSTTLLTVRAAGEAVVAVDTAVHTVAVLGAALPNGQVATSIGAVTSNTAGDGVFTAGYPTGSALFRYRAGKLETVQDSAVQGVTALSAVSWFSTWRGRYLALNNRGDAVHISQFYSGSVPLIVQVSAGVPKLVAALNVALPGGVPYRNFNSVAVDETGRVLFTATTTDGNNNVYFWDGNTVQRVIGVGDKTSSGVVNEVSNISGGGQGFVILLAFDNYRARELRYFDGHMRTLDSTDTTLLDGVWMNYFWMNETTLAGNGDAHYQVQTQDGGAGVYARRADGSLAIVARSRDPLPGGEWLIFPLTVSSGANGEAFFTAYTWNNGVQSLALYLATPQ
jgi:Bacterial Ig-like domain (group 2)